MAKRTGVLIITGSWPPMRCGVGDYSYNLAVAIAAAGLRVFVYTSNGGTFRAFSRSHDLEVLSLASGWGILSVLRSFWGLKRLLTEKKIDWVNIQYPAIGYGYSLGPQLLIVLLKVFLNVGVITTLHEFTQARSLRKISQIPFLLFSDKLIFTAENEATVIKALAKLSGFGKPSYSVIPVGSNIPVNTDLQVVKRKGFVVFFGLFYPGRQLEFVAEIFKAIAQKKDDVTFGMIGDVHPKYLRYYEEIRGLFEGVLPKEKLEWYIGETPENVAKVLCQANVAILPYPDGASFRRTTLIAALMGGVPVISTKGAVTPAELSEGFNIFFASDRSSFSQKASVILSNPELADAISVNTKKICRQFSWQSIAARYVSFIQGQDAR
ncbi:MAG: glycosyltransferase [Elusimicrobiales bacterium]|nr:glycosyltransferase [Elusimicrobiales bacterium]